MDYADFPSFFAGRLKERGFSLKRLSEMSGISLKHLEGLASGRFDDLPPPPYLHGYLLKLGQMLDFDGDSWWKSIKDIQSAKDFKLADQLPKNRFARAPVAKQLIFGGVVLLFLLYGVFRFSSIFGQPVVTLLYPETNVSVATADSVAIAGRATNASELSVNGESVPVQANGEWQKTVSLKPGMNAIEIKAKKFLGRETTITRQIIYQPPQTASSSAAGR